MALAIIPMIMLLAACGTLVAIVWFMMRMVTLTERIANELERIADSQQARS